MSRRWTRVGASLCPLACAAILAGGIADAQAVAAGNPGLRVRVPGQAGASVYRALRAMGRRLEKPQCRHVLDEFNSKASGRPLADALRDQDRTLERHIASLVFKDGSGDRACAPASVLAFTRVGSDTISVCAAPFLRATRGDPAFAEIALIHEVLHTLGLGENPPSSAEITARVAERCGDWASPLVVSGLFAQPDPRMEHDVGAEHEGAHDDAVGDHLFVGPRVEQHCRSIVQQP
jgi:hypothetical protein